MADDVGTSLNENFNRIIKKKEEEWNEFGLGSKNC